MTPSQWLDLAVLAIALIAGVSGWRSGALGSLLSFVGVILGAVAGVLLAPHVVSHIDGARPKLFVSLFLILGLVVIGEIAGVVLGRAVRGAIRNGLLRAFDSVIGVALQVVAVLIAAWLLASPLTSSDQPSLAAAVNGSRVLSEVNEWAPPWLKKIPKRLSALLEHLRPARRAAAVQPDTDRQRRRTGDRPCRRPRRRRDPTQRAQDPRRGAQLPKGARG